MRVGEARRGFCVGWLGEDGWTVGYMCQKNKKYEKSQRVTHDGDKFYTNLTDSAVVWSCAG